MAAAAGLDYGAHGATPSSLQAALAAGRLPSTFPPPPGAPGSQPPPPPPSAPPTVTTAHQPPPPGAPGGPNGPPGAPRSIFPPGFAPAPPPPSPHPSTLALDAERRRLEELQRVERQYAERMALATDPIIRLQMVGVTPELPGSPHFRHPYGILGGPPGKRPDLHGDPDPSAY